MSTLDTQKTIFYHRLNLLINFYKNPELSQAKNLNALSAILSRHVNKSPSYKWQYLLLLVNIKVSPSKKMILAVNKEYLSILNQPISQYESTTVFAKKNSIPAGTLILTTPTICSNCGQAYISDNTSQFCPFCSSKSNG